LPTQGPMAKWIQAIQHGQFQVDHLPIGEESP
jgi:hypothetical protein